MVSPWAKRYVWSILRPLIRNLPVRSSLNSWPAGTCLNWERRYLSNRRPACSLSTTIVLFPDPRGVLRWGCKAVPGKQSLHMLVPLFSGARRCRYRRVIRWRHPSSCGHAARLEKANFHGTAFNYGHQNPLVLEGRAGSAEAGAPPEAPATVPRVRPGPSTPMTAGPLRPAHDAPLGLAVAVKFTASAVPRRRLPWPSRSEGITATGFMLWWPRDAAADRKASSAPRARSPSRLRPCPRECLHTRYRSPCWRVRDLSIDHFPEGAG